MGLGDNRRSPKMLRKQRQAKKKAREQRHREARHVARKPPVTKAPSRGSKKS